MFHFIDEFPLFTLSYTVLHINIHYKAVFVVELQHLGLKQGFVPENNPLIAISHVADYHLHTNRNERSVGK